jgi:hypothetical protein
MPTHLRRSATHLSRRPLSDRIAAAVRRSLGTPRLRVEARRVRAASGLGNSGGWRIRLHERHRVSDAVDLHPPAIAVIEKLGIIPPEYHGDLRIALAGIREDWPATHAR